MLIQQSIKIFRKKDKGDRFFANKYCISEIVKAYRIDRYAGIRDLCMKG